MRSFRGYVDDYLICGEPDDSEPSQRLRCDCGAFLSKKPTDPEEWDEQKQEWILPVWVCARCKKVFDVDEMFR